MSEEIFSKELVAEATKKMEVANLQEATIGEVLLVASYLEGKTGIKFIRMDQGSPGLPANKIGVEAEKRALDAGVGSTYPAAAGVAELKEAASKFVKAFLNLDITPRACIPGTGSVASSFSSFIATTQSRCFPRLTSHDEQPKGSWQSPSFPWPFPFHLVARRRGQRTGTVGRG